MAKILILGAGRSSVYFVKQVQKYVLETNGTATIIDQSFETFPKELKQDKHTIFLEASIFKTKKIEPQISSHDIVVSMLPPQLHIEIAKSCLKFKKNLLTASYLSDEMLLLDKEVKKQGLLFLNELGVDPGLDHISALSLLDSINGKGGKVVSFKSHTGGIIAKKTPSNLWDYKITWNPKNVIRAGGEGAVFLENETVKKIDYEDIFEATMEVYINGAFYDSYANRDSLKYIDKYDLKNIKTCYRGTLRHNGFCEAWNVFVQLGMTDDMSLISLTPEATRGDFLDYFLGGNTQISRKKRFINKLGKLSSPNILEKWEQLGFFANQQRLTLVKGTAAELLQRILEESWKIEPADKDRLLMYHEIEYTIGEKRYKTTSMLSTIGANQQFTAMAKTVGAPLFEAMLFVLERKSNLKGVHIPNTKEIYEPLHKAIQKQGLFFEELTVLLNEESE